MNTRCDGKYALRDRWYVTIHHPQITIFDHFDLAHLLQQIDSGPLGQEELNHDKETALVDALRLYEEIA